MSLFVALFWTLIWVGLALAQGLPFPGPGSTAGISAPQSLGVRTISGITSTCNITTTNNILSGDLVFIVVQTVSTPLRTVSSIGDGTNTYAAAASINTTPGASYDNEIWYKGNTSAVGSGGTITVTLSGATSADGCAAQAFRVPGMNTVPLDKTATQAASTASPTVTTAVLAQASELAIGATYTSATATFTEASGFTNLINAQNVGLGSSGDGKASVSYKITAATTAVTYAPTWNTSGTVTTAIATFKGP